MIICKLFDGIFRTIVFRFITFNSRPKAGFGEQTVFYFPALPRHPTTCFMKYLGIITPAALLTKKWRYLATALFSRDSSFQRSFYKYVKKDDFFH